MLSGSIIISIIIIVIDGVKYATWNTVIFKTHTFFSSLLGVTGLLPYSP